MCYEAMLDAALDEIKRLIMDYRKEARWPEPEEDIKELLNKCSAAIFDIQIAYMQEKSQYYSKDDHKALRKKLRKVNVELPRYNKKKMDALHYEAPACLQSTFPKWNDTNLAKILSIKQLSVMKILPYLLATYYIDMIAGIDVFSTSKSDSSDSMSIFDEGTASEVAFYSAIKSICQKLSLRNYIESQCKKYRYYRQGTTRPLENGEYKEVISDPNTKLLHDYHAAKLIQAFVYSLFANLCSLCPNIDRLVDYEASFHLFNKHTCAFCTRYIATPVSKNYEMDTGMLFDDDPGLEHIAKVLRVVNQYDLRESYQGETEEQSVCATSSGIDQMPFGEIPLNLSAQELFRLHARIYTAFLHPIFCKYCCWPTLRDSDHQSGMWEMSKKRKALLPIESKNSTPPIISNETMPWEDVAPFFSRRLGSPRSSKK